MIQIHGNKNLISYIKKELKIEKINSNKGILCGSFLTNRIMKFFQLENPHKYNDIDIFYNTNRLKSFFTLKSIDDYELENVDYKITKSIKKNNINKTFYIKTKKTKNIAKKIMESFDINSIRIVLDLKKNKFEVCPHFYNYIKSRELNIINYNTPVKSCLRILKKYHVDKVGFLDKEELFQSLDFHSKGFVLIENIENFNFKYKKLIDHLDDRIKYSIDKQSYRVLIKTQKLSNHIIYSSEDCHPLFISKMNLNKIKTNVVEEFDKGSKIKKMLLSLFSFNQNKYSLHNISDINKVNKLITKNNIEHHHNFILKLFYNNSLKDILLILNIVHKLDSNQKLSLIGLIESDSLSCEDVLNSKSILSLLKKFHLEQIKIKSFCPIINQPNFILKPINSSEKCRNESNLMFNCIRGYASKLKKLKKENKYLFHLVHNQIDYSILLQINLENELDIIEIKKMKNERLNNIELNNIKNILYENLYSYIQKELFWIKIKNVFIKQKQEVVREEIPF